MFVLLAFFFATLQLLPAIELLAGVHKRFLGSHDAVIVRELIPGLVLAQELVGVLFDRQNDLVVAQEHRVAGFDRAGSLVMDEDTMR